jgi:hydrogenase/urease accessory protein HupE
MQIRIALILLSGMSLFFSSSAFAHMSPSEGGLMSTLLHFLTGLHHLPLLILVGIGIVYFIHKNRKAEK